MAGLISNGSENVVKKQINATFKNNVKAYEETEILEYLEYLEYIEEGGRTYFRWNSYRILYRNKYGEDLKVKKLKVKLSKKVK